MDDLFIPLCVSANLRLLSSGKIKIVSHKYQRSVQSNFAHNHVTFFIRARSKSLFKVKKETVIEKKIEV